MPPLVPIPKIHSKHIDRGDRVDGTRDRKSTSLSTPLFTALVATIAFCVIMAFTFAIDWYMGTTESREARISLLENRMNEKTRPVINVQRATIYNTDGEIVIESK